MKRKACSPLTSAARPCRSMIFALKTKQGGDVFTSVCWWLVNQEDRTKLQDRLLWIWRMSQGRIWIFVWLLNKTAPYDTAYRGADFLHLHNIKYVWVRVAYYFLCFTGFCRWAKPPPQNCFFFRLCLVEILSDWCPPAPSWKQSSNMWHHRGPSVSLLREQADSALHNFLLINASASSIASVFLRCSSPTL